MVDLIAEIKIGNKSKVEELLKFGSDPNFQDGNGDTPLIMAAYRGNIEIVTLLLNSKANTNNQNIYMEIPLFCLLFDAITQKS